jgi:hypothetical protein
MTWRGRKIVGICVFFFLFFLDQNLSFFTAFIIFMELLNCENPLSRFGNWVRSEYDTEMIRNMCVCMSLQGALVRNL